MDIKLEKPNMKDKVMNQKNFDTINIESVKKLEENRSNELSVNSSNSIVEKYKTRKKKEVKKRTSLSFKESTFNKLITLSAMSGESISCIVEEIIEDAVKDVRINHEAVREHMESIKSKKEEKDIVSENKEED